MAPIKATSILVASLALIVGVSAPAAAQQPADTRVFVNVNVGASLPATGDFSHTRTFPILSRTETETYHAGTRLAFDIGAGVMAGRAFGVGVTFGNASRAEAGDVTVTIPNRLLSGQFITHTGPTSQPLKHAEQAVNLEGILVPFTSHGMTLRVFGGPSYIRLRQDLVRLYSTIETITAGVDDFTFSTSFQYEQNSTSAWGFNVGGDVSTFPAKHVGVGGFVRYSRAEVDVKAASNPGRDSLGPPASTTVRLGGVLVGGGVRLRF